MRALLLGFLLLVASGCYHHGGYYGHHHGGWHHAGAYHHHNTIEGTREVSRQTLSLPERARLGRIEGERTLQQNLDRMHRR